MDADEQEPRHALRKAALECLRAIKRAEREEQHRKDVSLLKMVLAEEDLFEDRRLAFTDMLERVETHPTWTLTDKQRAWVRVEADRLGLSEETPFQRNRNVPRGREVERAAVLKVLPKRPPGRRV